MTSLEKEFLPLFVSYAATATSNWRFCKYNILSPNPVEKRLRPEPAFPRNMCMEFAIGSLEKVLGPEFAIVDSYNVRVRLPLWNGQEEIFSTEKRNI